MSTRGCIGIRSGNETHLVVCGSDSYPASLGHSLVTQIAEADLELWRQLANKVRATEAWYGPDFRLTHGEIARIRKWLAERVGVETWIDADQTPPDDGWITAARSPSEWRPIWTSEELARLLAPVLEHDPAKFFDILTWKIYPLLDLGLLPRLSPAFLASPFCEWVYVIDFVDDLFIVGTHGDCDESAAEPSTSPWEPCEEREFECLARFPLAAIPQGWEQRLQTDATAED
jgi:hypothetical protein